MPEQAYRGKGKRTGRSGDYRYVYQTARKYTAAKDVQVEEFASQSRSRGLAPGGRGADYTDLVSAPSTWMTDDQIDDFANRAQATGLFSAETAERWAGDPDSVVSDMDDWQFEVLSEYFDRFFESETRDEREQTAVEQAFAGEAAARRARRTEESAQADLFDDAISQKAPVYYASGSNSPAQIRGLANIGAAEIGVAAPEISKSAEQALTDLAGQVNPETGEPVRVFVDSGAFSEVSFPDGVPTVTKPISPAEWDKRLNLYERLADALGEQLVVVAPDQVGFQNETLKRLKVYAGRMQTIASKGAQVMVPLQGGRIRLAEFEARAREALGIDNVIPALPMKKGATSTAEIMAYVQAAQPARLHLLGMGERNNRVFDVERLIKRLSPDTVVSLDSSLVRANVGRGRSKEKAEKKPTAQVEMFKAARGEQHADHKYLRREGTPGNYKYIYTEPGERKEPGRNARKNLTILSMGLGRDSITMLLLAREGRLMVDGEAFSGDDLDAVAFSDPGYEWPHTYALIPRVKKICQEMNVPFLILQKPKKEGELGWEAHHEKRLARQAQRGKDTQALAAAGLASASRIADAGKDALIRALPKSSNKHVEAPEIRAEYYFRVAEKAVKRKKSDGEAAYQDRIDAPIDFGERPVQFEPSWVTEGKKKETLEERAQAGTYHTRGPILEDYERLCKITLRASAACTSNQKIHPINSRLVNDMSTLKFGVGSSKGEWGREVTAGNREKHRILIGIAADEEHRLRGAEESASTSNFTRPVYPLAEMGIAKPDEQEILERHGFGDTRKSGCVGCHFQPTSWYWALRELQPEAFQRVVEYEERAVQFAKENGLTVKYLGGTKPLPERVDAFVARHNPTPEDVDRILDKEYGRAKKESKQIGLDLVGIDEPRKKKRQQAAILLMDDNPDAEQLGLFAMSTRYLMDLSKARTPFRSLLKAARGQAYQGKGKRKGTPGHYTYEYDEPQQGSFASILQETRPAPSKPAPQKDEPWFDVYGPRGAPRPGEKGYKEDPTRPPGAHDGQEPYDLVIDMLDQASRVWSDEDWAQIYQGGHPDFEYSDLPDLIGVPVRDGKGKLYSENARLHIAERMIELARETREEWAEGGDLDIPLPETTQSRKSTETKPLWSIEPYRDGFHFPKWVVAAALADSMDRDNLKMRLALVSKDEARAFIEKHHSALPYLNPKGLMYAIGVKRGGRLVAVATAGTPTGNWSKTGRDPHQILELTRVASDGTAKGAASKLVSRLIDLLPQSGRSDPDKPALLVTYQLESESGTTYTALRDKGLRPVASVRGSAPSGARAGASTQSLAHVDKIVWEAGPEARPAKWGLLESADQVEMFKAVRGQAYQGKGKRKGTPGHYTYVYDEARRGRRKQVDKRQLDLFAAPAPPEKAPVPPMVVRRTETVDEHGVKRIETTDERGVRTVKYVEPEKVPELPDRVEDWDHIEQLSDLPLDVFERSIANDHVEHGAAYLEDPESHAYDPSRYPTVSRQIWQKTGESRSIRISPVEAKIFRREGNVVFTHSHPAPYPLSGADITCAMAWNLKEMRCVTPQGDAWKITRPPEGWGQYVQRWAGELPDAKHKLRPFEQRRSRGSSSQPGVKLEPGGSPFWRFDREGWGIDPNQRIGTIPPSISEACFMAQSETEDLWNGTRHRTDAHFGEDGLLGNLDLVEESFGDSFDVDAVEAAMAWLTEATSGNYSIHSQEYKDAQAGFDRAQGKLKESIYGYIWARRLQAAFKQERYNFRIEHEPLPKGRQLGSGRGMASDAAADQVAFGEKLRHIRKRLQFRVEMGHLARFRERLSNRVKKDSDSELASLGDKVFAVLGEPVKDPKRMKASDALVKVDQAIAKLAEVDARGEVLDFLLPKEEPFDSWVKRSGDFGTYKSKQQMSNLWHEDNRHLHLVDGEGVIKAQSFFGVMKSAYRGKGKRTGTPGHYEYDYEQGSLPKEGSPHRSEGGKVGMVTVAGRKLSAEKTDTDDTFPPAIAAFKVVDGWLAYRGRNGSEGVVVGRRSELDKWKADVQKHLKQVPIAQPAKQWRESDGGKEHIEFAAEAANRTAKAFGQPAPKLEFLVDGKSRASGEAGHNKLTVVNAHTGSRTDYTGVFEGINTHGGAHIAAHETTHSMYGVNPQAGKKAEAAVAAHAKEHGAITMYHATSNHHEGLMEATALFVLNKRAMESKAPKLARAIAAWMTEVSTLNKARGQAYQGTGKRTGTPGNYKYTYAQATKARSRITEEQSPLKYNTVGTVHRLSIKDPAVPAYPHDQYHPQGLVSFIDYQLYDGGKRVYINYMSTHPDQYRQGHARQLMDALYQKFSDKEEINWGEIHSDAAEAMFRERRERQDAAPRDPVTGYQILSGPRTYGKTI